MNRAWKAGFVAATAATGLTFGYMAHTPPKTLPHQNDANYVPVLEWMDQPTTISGHKFPMGSNLVFEPANDFWTCVANNEANPDMECNESGPVTPGDSQVHGVQQDTCTPVNNVPSTVVCTPPKGEVIK